MTKEGAVASSDGVDNAVVIASDDSGGIRTRSPLRWVVLVLSIVATMGSYWAFDNPAATFRSLREYMGESKEDFNPRFNALYSAYAFPNLVLPLLAGVFVDFLGPGVMLLILASTVFVGQVVFAVGALEYSWPIMWVGRALFGVGAESQTVALNAVVVKWFFGREVALALGCIVAIGRLSSASNDIVSTMFGDPVTAYWLGAGLCGVSLVAVILLVCLESAFDTATHGKSSVSTFACGWLVRVSVDSNPLIDTPEAPKQSWSDLWAALYRTLVATTRLPWRAYYMAVYVIPAWTTTSTFNNIAVDYLDARWPGRAQSHSSYIGITFALIFFTTALVAPIWGLVIDRIDRRIPIMIASAIFSAVTHALLGFAPQVPPEVAFPMLGFAFAMCASAFWPAVALTVPKEQRGVAFGLATAVQNVGLATMPLIASTLQPPACNGTFECVELFLIALALVSLCFGCVLLYLGEPSQKILARQART